MSKDSDSDVELESGSDTDSDWLSKEGPLKLKNQWRKRKKTKRSSGRSSDGSRRVSFSPDVLSQKRLTSSTTVPLQLGKSLEKKPEFPVTCGNKEGVLHKDRFNKSEPCIMSAGQWFTPTQFEKFGGKERTKNWKNSICYSGLQLKVLILKGLLSSPSFKMKRSRDKEPQSRKEMIRSRISTRHDCHTISSVRTSASSSESDHSTGDKEDDDGGEDDDDDVDDDDSFSVTCSTGKGVLYVSRFATDTHGKCIRTQEAWLTPKDFLNQNIVNGNWRRDIVRNNGAPLGELIMMRVLKPHVVNCPCYICKGDLPHVLDQNNDDWCFKCKGDEEEDLVCCSTCPRSFHYHCHKPALKDNDILSDQWTCSFCKKSVPETRKSTHEPSGMFEHHFYSECQNAECI